MALPEGVTRGLLATNVVILVRRLPASALPTQAQVSSITLAELSVGPLLVADASERAERQAHLQWAEDKFEALPFDAPAARAFARVAASLRRTGRKHEARTFDAMIAAVALANGLPLYTCNPDDFDGIAGLQVVAVPYPETEPA